MISRFLAVARNTFLESIRQPIYGILLLLVAGFLILNLFFSSFTLDDDNVLLVELGLSTLLLSGMVLASFTATGVLTREIEKRTVLTVVSKPISRPTFFLAKFAGIILALLLAEWIWTLVFLMTVRHGVLMRATDLIDVPVILFGGLGILCALLWAGFSNYRWRTVFSASLTLSLATILPVATLLTFSFDKTWTLQSPLADLRPEILAAIVLLCEAVVILAAVALAASARLPRVGTLTICILVLFFGLSIDYFFAAFSEGNILGSVLYALLPNLQFMWAANALSQGSSISVAFFGYTTAYALLYTVAILAIGVALFQDREVG